ncbi:hypothetical protein DM806_04990 [Sphingobium lactosutens]|nr:hypothetical protein [Sphingobium lactosutens]
MQISSAQITRLKNNAFETDMVKLSKAKCLTSQKEARGEAIERAICKVADRRRAPDHYVPEQSRLTAMKL